ncbi:MAG: class A beta-lactamase-related serine hydrolase [Oscillospiraceae bacterium]|nr:class A beta-lactamase-related serine hydrolase [Oscillospiraceae bacterium]
MRKTIAITLALSLAAFVGCGVTAGQHETEDDLPVTDTDYSSATAIQPTADEPEEPTELLIDSEETDDGNAPLVIAPISYGWNPDVIERRIPPGMDDIVGETLSALVNYNRMNFYIGVVDLMDPINGYRHIDTSGGLHPSSMIKTWIAEYAFLQIQNGNANLNDIIAGSSLNYHLRQMLQVSDNESTAYIIEHFGRENIDEHLKENYSYTRLNSDLRGFNYLGNHNAASVSDSLALLERIWYGSHSEPYSTMLSIMFNSRTRSKIPAALSRFPGVSVANKTGSYIDEAAADHDMGIVVEYDAYGNIVVAYAIAIYTFSQPQTGAAFSAARPTILSVVQHIHRQFQFHNYGGGQPEPYQTEFPDAPDANEEQELEPPYHEYELEPWEHEPEPEPEPEPPKTMRVG